MFAAKTYRYPFYITLLALLAAAWWISLHAEAQDTLDERRSGAEPVPGEGRGAELAEDA